MMGAHRLFAKGVMYEEAIKVPLMIRLPHASYAPTRVGAPVSQIDLVPTLLDAMGQAVPSELPGQSRMSELAAGSFQEQDVFVEWTSPAAAEAWHEEQLPHDEPVRTIITPDGWKLNRRKHDVNELFDLRSDPAELDNLSGRSRYREVEAHLSRRIDWWREATSDPIEV
jgi:arylsulfatase A-like enzyme